MQGNKKYLIKLLFCNGLNYCKKEGIRQRQTYKRTAKQLVRDTHNRKHPKRRKKAQKAHTQYEFGNKVGLITTFVLVPKRLRKRSNISCNSNDVVNKPTFIK